MKLDPRKSGFGEQTIELRPPAGPNAAMPIEVLNAVIGPARVVLGGELKGTYTFIL